MYNSFQSLREVLISASLELSGISFCASTESFNVNSLKSEDSTSSRHIRFLSVSDSSIIVVVKSTSFLILSSQELIEDAQND
jgi:hypothetical protein